MNLFRFLFRDKLFGYFSLGAFCLSFLSEVGLLMSNSIIVSKLGATEYATLYFWAILLSMLFYVFFSAFKDSSVRIFYGFVLGVLLLTSVFFYQQPESNFWLKCFIVSFLLVDFIGPNVFSGVLINNASPTVFREVFQRVLSVQLLARIVGAFCMVALAKTGYSSGSIYIFWIIVFAHLFSLVKVVSYSRSPDEGSQVRASLTQMRDAFTFLFKNHFIRLVLQISILANVIRLLVDYVYLQKVGLYVAGGNEVSAFLGSVSLGTILCVYTFQRFIGKRLVLSKNLGLLYSVQPIGVILAAVAMFLIPGVGIAVALMIYAQSTGRGIQLPLFRQSMVALPKNLRSSVMFIISIFLSASGLFVSASLSLTKDMVGVNVLALVLVSVCVLLLLIVARLDSFYVRNLWSAYKEMKDGQWLERRLGHSNSPFHLVTQMSMVALEESTLEDPLDENKIIAPNIKKMLEEYNPLKKLSNFLRVEPRHSEIRALLSFCLASDRISVGSKRILLRRVYEACYDKETLKIASEYHKCLLSSEDAGEVLEGIRLAETLGLKRLKRLLGPLLSAKDPLVAQAAEIALSTEAFLEALPLKKLSGITLRKLRSVARDFIQAGDEAKLFTKIECLLQTESEKRIRAIIDILYHPKFSLVREQVLLGIDLRRQKFSIQPLLRQLINLDYRDAQEIRWALRRIGFGAQKNLVFLEINRILSLLLENQFSVWDSQKFEDKINQNLFLHALFLEEWVDSMYMSINYFTHTIKDLIELKGQEKEMLSSIHLEYLKKNVSYPIWRVFLAQNPKHSDWLKAKRELTKLLVSAS